MHILPLERQSGTAIEALLDAAFGPDRHGRTAYAIRKGMDWLPGLSFALETDRGGMIGLLQSWPVQIVAPDGTAGDLIMIGPVAVEPAHQRDGHGHRLMNELIARARMQHVPPLVMIGDPEYYGRFWGFDAQHSAGWQVPGPVERHRLLALPLNGEALPRTGMLGPRTATPT